MRNRYIAVLLIIIACVIAYANSLDNGFVWDDNMFIKDNYFIRDVSNLTNIFQSDFWETSVKGQKGTFYRPLITASLIIDYAVWELNPFGYHLTNLIMFIICALLVWLCAGFFLSRTAALIAGLLFAVHTIHTESVTFILGRTDIFAGCFMFASFAMFLYADNRLRSPLKSPLFWWSVVAFMASLFCKESAIMALPLFCVATACRRNRSHPVAVKRLFVMMIPFAAVVVCYLLVRRMVYAGPIKYEHIPPGGTMFNTLVTMPKIVLIYIGKLFFPIGLSIDYQPAVITSLLSPMFIIPALIVAALAVLSIAGCLTSIPAYAGFWFFVSILPVMNIIPIGLFMADRFLFIPSFGFVILAGWIFERTPQRAPLSFQVPFNVRLCIFVLIMLCMTILTVRRNFDWRSEIRLWTKTARTTPASYRAHGSLGQIFLHKGMYKAALAETKLAALYHPNESRILGNLGVIYLKMNQLDKAAEFFRKSLDIDPHDFRSWANLFLIYSELGNHGLAVDAVNRAIEYSPQNLRLWKMKANYLENIGRYKDALRTYTEALRTVKPDLELLFGLADLYRDHLNNPSMATQVYKKILSIEPNNPRAKQGFYQTRNR